MKRRVEAGLPALSGMFNRAEVTYAWPREDGSVGSDREPVALFTGEAVHAYLGHLPDAAIEAMLNELAAELGAALGQERIYVAFAAGPGSSTPAARKGRGDQARSDPRNGREPARRGGRELEAIDAIAARAVRGRQQRRRENSNMPRRAHPRYAARQRVPMIAQKLKSAPRRRKFSSPSSARAFARSLGANATAQRQPGFLPC